MRQAILNRYGFGYVPAPQLRFPEPKPLYSGDDDTDFVREHGEWCLARCIGAEAAERLPIPATSIPAYAANEAAIRAAMEA